MVHTADLPYAAGGLDPLGPGRLHFHSQPLDIRLVDAPSGYPTSVFARPLGPAASSKEGSSHRHWPPYHAYPLDQRDCYGAYDPRDRRPQPFDWHLPDHREECRDRAPGAVGLSASVLLSPPADRRAGYGVGSPSVVPAPDRHMSRGTSSGRPLRARRGFDIWLVPSPLARSTEGKRYRDYQQHLAHDESSRSPVSTRRSGDPSHCRYPGGISWKTDARDPSHWRSSKRYRLEDGRKDSSSGGRWYDDDERIGNRTQCGDGRLTEELTYQSSFDQEHDYGGASKRSFSLRDHGERSFSVQHHLSPWDDGYKSPSSPTYCCEDDLDMQRGLHDDYQDESCASGVRFRCRFIPIAMNRWTCFNSSVRFPDWPDSTYGSYDGSGIAGREPNFKYEDPLLKTKKEDSAYAALVDDFMDAVLKNWRKPVNPNVTVDKEAHQKQTYRFAELALKRYNKNKNNKVKYSLVEAIAGAAIFEDSELYAHVNFYAKAKNGPTKNDGKILVFAELHHIGRRPNAMILTCFHLFDENCQLSGRRNQVRSSHIIQDQDMGHCYACSEKIKHPDGSCYKAGHLVDMLCYHN